MLERADTAEAIGLNRRASALLDVQPSVFDMVKGDSDWGKLCCKRAGESVAQAAGKDWSAALAKVQAATLSEDCRPEIASSSEASEGGVSEPPNPDRKGEGSHD